MSLSPSSLVSASARIVLLVTMLSALATGLHDCAAAEVCNIKVVTDGNPDYTDMGSMIHSATSNWPTAVQAVDRRQVPDAAKPGKLIEETPTLKCLGVRWLIGGDGNANARVAVAYRKLGSETWHPALDLFRVETAAIREPNRPDAELRFRRIWRHMEAVSQMERRALRYDEGCR